MKPSICQHCGARMRPGDPLHFLDRELSREELIERLHVRLFDVCQDLYNLGYRELCQEVDDIAERFDSMGDLRYCAVGDTADLAPVDWAEKKRRIARLREQIAREREE